MSGSLGLVSWSLFLIFTITRAKAQCTKQELNTLLQCITPYNSCKFLQIFGTGNSCNRTLISENVCSDFAAIVVCANQQTVSRTTCRPNAVGQINQRLEIPCKIFAFEEMCTKAPAIDKGAVGGEASGPGISLGLLGAVTMLFLMAHV